MSLSPEQNSPAYKRWRNERDFQDRLSIDEYELDTEIEASSKKNNTQNDNNQLQVKITTNSDERKSFINEENNRPKHVSPGKLAQERRREKLI